MGCLWAPEFGCKHWVGSEHINWDHAPASVSHRDTWLWHICPIAIAARFYLHLVMLRFLFKNIPRWRDKAEQWKGWIEVWHIWYIVRTFVNATVYPHPAQQRKNNALRDGGGGKLTWDTWVTTGPNPVLLVVPALGSVCVGRKRKKACFCGRSQFGKLKGPGNQYGEARSAQAAWGHWVWWWRWLASFGSTVPAQHHHQLQHTGPETHDKVSKWKMCFSYWIACINSLEMFSKCKSLTLLNFYFTQ
jgi:hypothetical protein